MENGIDISQPIFGSPLLEWLSLYGYFILLPLLVLEGRVIGVIASALAHAGYLNIFLVWATMILAGTISDVFYYYLGKSGSLFAHKFWFTRKIVERFRDNKTAQTASSFFEKHGAKTFFFTKSVSSISWPLQIAAGASDMDARKFFGACAAANVVWSTVFAAIGYFMGYLAQNISVHFVIAISVLVVALIYIVGKRVSKRFSKEEIFGEN